MEFHVNKIPCRHLPAVVVGLAGTEVQPFTVFNGTCWNCPSSAQTVDDDGATSDDRRRTALDKGYDGMGCWKSKLRIMLDGSPHETSHSLLCPGLPLCVCACESVGEGSDSIGSSNNKLNVKSKFAGVIFELFWNF